MSHHTPGSSRAYKFEGLRLNEGKTDLPYPNETWQGYMSPENRYTMEKLQVLDPNEFAPAVMGQREKLKEQVFQTTYLKVDGEIRKKIHEKLVPKNSFILGQKFITPSYVANRRRSDGYAEQELEGNTIAHFGSIIEESAKKSGNEKDGTYFSSLNIDGVEAQFNWTEDVDRSLDLLTGQTVIGSVSFTAPAKAEDTAFLEIPAETTKTITMSSHEIPENLLKTVEYTLFEDDNGVSIHRHVWLADPAYRIPQLPAGPQSLKGDRREEYDKLLAGIIENTYQMEQSVNEGYAAVDNIEASEVIDRLS